MRALVLVAVIATTLSALSISVTGAKLDNSFFSSAHIRHSEKFSCLSKKDDFQKITKIYCIFHKRPKKTFQPINDRFFEIKSQQRENRFYIEITPTYDAYLEPVCNDVTENIKIRAEKCKRSNHWLAIGYKEKRPLIENDKIPPLGINFPITIESYRLPSVGSLDIAGNPIYFEEVKDVSDYLAIKKLFERKEYYDVISEVDTIIKKDGNSLFNAELLLYKIRSLYKVENYTDLNQVTKEFLRRFSSDKSIDEILYLSAKANEKLGLANDADYFYARLLDEHPGTAFATYGLIALGEQKQRSGDSNKAEKLYKRGLYETKDLDAASTASEHLANLYLIKNDPYKAAEYTLKIVEANPNYLIARADTSFELAQNLADKEQFSTAQKIASILLDATNPIGETFEKYYRHKVIWTDQSGEKRLAFDLYNGYLKKFEYGENEQYMKKRRDDLFFDLDESNTTKQIAHYDTLIDKYRNDTIANKATYEKALLLHKKGKYADVLELEDKLNNLDKDKYREIDSIIDNSAIELAQTALANKECIAGLNLMKRYDVNVSSVYDDYLFGCMLNSGNYKDAKNIAQKHLKEEKTEKRLIWLNGYLKILKQDREYAQMADIANDILTLAQIEENKNYDDIWYELFDAYSNLNYEEKMLKTAIDIEKNLTDRFENIEPFMQIVRLGKEKKDYTLVRNYAKKVMQLQNSKKSYTYSPSIEFAFVEALREQKEQKEAIKVLKMLLKISIGKKELSRVYYLLGTLYQSQNMKGEAKKSYEQSGEISPDSAWANLSKDALKLIK